MFVYGTYVLEEEVDANFSLGDTWKLFQEDPLPNNTSNFCRQMTNCIRVWNYIQKTSGFPLSIKHTQKIMMDRKDALVCKYRKSPVFTGSHIFAPADHIERYMDLNF